MGNIWFSSDTHFGHDRDFIWGARGFKNVTEMNEQIVKNWNSVVKEDDIVYLLGDIMLGDGSGLKYLKQLNGTIYIALGNHDTNSRAELYKECHNVADVQMGYRIKAGKRTVILSHYPTITANGDDIKTLNFYAHTHQQDNNFFEGRKYMYHVGLDSHNCYPVKLETILEEIKNA